MLSKLAKIALIAVIVLPLFISPALACFNPTDSFATEVLLNKSGIFYNLKTISQTENVRAAGDFDREDSARIIDYRSHYNFNVAVRLFVDSGKDQPLSVKIQIPTKLVKISYPEIKIELDLPPITQINEDRLRSLGYQVEGRFQQNYLKQLLKKENIEIAIWSIEDHSGFSANIRNQDSLTPESEEEFKDILKAYGLDSNLWSQAEIKTETKEDADLASAIEDVDPDTFNWSEAMKTELIWLRDNGVVTGLTDLDINQISSACKRGTAGHNSRIFYEDGKWLPYNQSSNPMLLRGVLDCSGFAVEMLPSGVLTSLPAVSANDDYFDIDRLGQFLSENQWIFLLVILWILPWKGLALWKSARLNDKWWFIALLVINTLALLEILYIFIFSKRKR